MFCGCVLGSTGRAAKPTRGGIVGAVDAPLKCPRFAPLPLDIVVREGLEA